MAMQMGIGNDEFKAVMTKFAAGVTVVTTVDTDGTLFGLTATAFTSLSMNPPLCLVCVDKTTGSHDPIERSRLFAVNFLTDQQESVSNTFASRRDDKFDNVKHEKGPATQCPVFPEALAWLECEISDVLPGGDHDIFVGMIKKVQINGGLPLDYWNGGYADVKSRPRQW
jgi:flavin reductase (DIM6/NTAB) family NADH-FMN oxidoreductase RutF